MAEKYTPKVGDKVRATLGENVLVGELTYVGNDEINIEAQGARWQIAMSTLDPWKFEHIVSVPSKFGAVIRNNSDGQLYVRHACDVDAREMMWVPLSAIDELADDGEATAGGFTVLFDGVDE